MASRPEFEIDIVKLAYGGAGLGYVNGKVCFVEKALPGERVRAQLQRDKKNFCTAMTVEILKPSPMRLQPPCPYVGECGGCQYQHMQYAEECRGKEQQVRDLFVTRLGIRPEQVRSLVPSPESYGYRQHVTLHYTPEGRPGFISEDNERVVPVEHCLLADSALEAAFEEVFESAPPEASCTFWRDADGKMVTSRVAGLYPVALGGRTFWASTRGFFQANPAVTRKIADQVRSWVEDFQPEYFADLYAGAGPFALLAGREVPFRICVEAHPASLEALKHNAASLPHTEIVEGQVEAVFPQLAPRLASHRSFLFLDPPRQGMDSRLCEALAAFEGAAELVYLSCHPGSLVRDLQLILSAKKWKLREVIPYDMFPRTTHIETAVHLQRT